jgi:hypothetical protein
LLYGTGGEKSEKYCSDAPSFIHHHSFVHSNDVDIPDCFLVWLGIDQEDLLSVAEEEKDEEPRGRAESYELDSFVCATGYLSGMYPSSAITMWIINGQFSLCTVPGFYSTMDCYKSITGPHSLVARSY